MCYNFLVQQLDYETGQDWKIAALNKIIVCTYFLKYIQTFVCKKDDNI